MYYTLPKLEIHPLLSKQFGKRQLEAAQNTFPAQHIPLAQLAELRDCPKDEHFARRRLHNPDALDANRKILCDLSTDTIPAIRGRNNLNDQFRCCCQKG